jgi:hypothetical protein
MVPATVKHPTLNPAPLVDEAIVSPYGKPGSYGSAPSGVLEQRLRELDREWDVERLTAATFGLLLLFGLFLVSPGGEHGLVIPAVAAACLLLHALVGWTPIMPLMRVLGFRTPREIAHERHDLEIRRRDVQTAGLARTPQDREDLSRFENEGGSPAG